jgi:hypothetical protein
MSNKVPVAAVLVVVVANRLTIEARSTSTPG